MISPFIWVCFIVLIIALMSLDLGVFNKRDHIPDAKEALRNTMIWVVLAGLFGVFIYFGYENHWLELGRHPYEPMGGGEAVLKYITGYLLEESLSVDNLFVIAIIFSRFKVPRRYQHKVLFWGIIGVLIFRGILIALGTALVHSYMWLFYAFGALLLYSAYKLYRHDDENLDEDDIDKNRVVRFVRIFFPVYTKSSRGYFFLRENGRRTMTTLMVALLVVELTDVMFAFDSVPAVLSITTDPFLVFSSNIFAILGLRSLFFLLSDFLDRFHNLRYSLIAILSFIGVKMILIPPGIHIPVLLSLGIIAVCLAAGVFTSMKKPA